MRTKTTNATSQKKELKKWQIVLIVIVILWIIGAAIGGKDSSEKKGKAETVLDNHEGIIWKDEDKMGIANLKLDGSKSKEVIIAEYYTEISSYVADLDKESLKDYEYIEFKGNVIRDGKIECTIKGNLPIDFIKSSTDLTSANIEDNLKDLFMPKPLR